MSLDIFPISLPDLAKVEDGQYFSFDVIFGEEMSKTKK